MVSTRYAVHDDEVTIFDYARGKKVRMTSSADSGIVEYFGTRMNRNQFRNILGYFGTTPIYPVPSGRIFRNRQDISEPLPFVCDEQYLTLHNR